MSDPRDLCTLNRVRELMQKKSADTAQDSLISSRITTASVKIMRDYGREFVPGGPDGIAHTAATRTFEYPWQEQATGEAFVSLAPYDLQLSPVPTIVADTDQATTVPVTTDEYRLWPLPATQNVYMAVRMLPLNVSVGIIGWRKRQIQVTGNWGFPSVPEEVAEACAETVVHWITANPAGQRFAQPDGARPIPARSYPMTALDLLSSFKRMTV